MSNTDGNKRPMKPSLRIIHLPGLQIPINIPDDVMDKIEFLCQKINKEEWSGVLFYSVQGSMKKVSELSITLRDVLLMDKGTKAYTEYNWDESIVEYQMDNPESLDWLKGHIHSHNTMSVFFSSTDNEELTDNVGNHNVYLSLIVNNFNDMTAKLAFTATSQSQYICKDVDGSDYRLKLENVAPPELMLTYDCTITKRERETAVPDGFRDRLDKIVKKSEYKTMHKQPALISSDINSPYHKDNNYPKKREVFYGGNTNTNMYGKGSFGTEDDWAAFSKMEKAPFMEDDNFHEVEEDDDPFMNIPSYSEESAFIAYALRLGVEFKNDTIIDALDDTNDIINSSVYAKTFCNNYEIMFQNFFKGQSKFLSESGQTSVSNKLLEVIESYSVEYPLLQELDELFKVIKNTEDTDLPKALK